MNDKIIIKNACLNNLKGINLSLEKNQLIVITGPSGSGKSTLAFDTIFAEGQRRYIESLSSYARQFLHQHKPAQVDSITGLSPAIAIDQKTISHNPRSTVGTLTEIYDYMRILFSKVGDLYDPETNQILKCFTPSQAARNILSQYEEGEKLFIGIQKENITEKKVFELGLNKYFFNKKTHRFEDFSDVPDGSILLVDRIKISENEKQRLVEAIERTYENNNGSAVLIVKNEQTIFNESLKLNGNMVDLNDVSPLMFSFNSPQGACPSCKGIGKNNELTPFLLIEDKEKLTLEGAIPLIYKKNNFLRKMTESYLKIEKSENKKISELTERVYQELFYGSTKIYKYQFSSKNSFFEFEKKFPGIIPWLTKKYRESTSQKTQKEIERFMTDTLCSACNGTRLNPTALQFKVGKKTISELSETSISELNEFFQKIKLSKTKEKIAKTVLKEIRSRLIFLSQVGVGYLNLNRSCGTLSGGEGQRIRLATQIGSALSGILYVLDEPSIGLHPADNELLIKTIRDLQKIGNTIIVVEHDEETIKHADYVIDIGPKAGIHGGEVTAEGKLKEIIKNDKSLTGAYISKKNEIQLINKETVTPSNFIKLKGATENNLKNIDVTIPHDGLTVIVGPSGSGKSSLIHQTLVPAIKSKIANKSNQVIYEKDNFKHLSGYEDFKTIIELDQSPIGRTPKSNPATYTDLFSELRNLFTQLPESKIRGYKSGRFSFNVKGGRCENCEGNGQIKVEMHFLPDVYIECSECLGKRYNPETLEIKYKGHNIAEMLDLTVSEAASLLKNHKKIKRILTTLEDVGLGYLKLGQPATTLSGGEAQRLKLSREISKATKGKTLYVLDEPTTGLHFDDINQLLFAIQKLKKKGHTIIIVEHNVDIIKNADYIIELGPTGGTQGGKVTFTGTAQDLKKAKKSITGKFL